MQTFLLGLAIILIRAFTDNVLTPANIKRAKNFIVAQEKELVDKTVKHQRARDMLLDMAPGLAETVVDYIVRTLLWIGRK